MTTRRKTVEQRRQTVYFSFEQLQALEKLRRREETRTGYPLSVSNLVQKLVADALKAK